MFTTFFYNPIYNLLIFILDVLPLQDLGFAVIVLTIIIKLVLFPLSKKSIKNQIKQKELEPELKALKEKYKDDREKQAREMMEVYKKAKLNPFSSILLVLIQLPILFALYFVFLKGGLPNVNIDILYSFINIPNTIHTTFLGLIDLTQRSLVLALLAGVTQFFLIRLTLSHLTKKEDYKFGEDKKEDLMNMVQTQMKYGLPVVVFIVSYGLSSAIALYWTVSNTFMYLQEKVIRKNINQN